MTSLHYVRPSDLMAFLRQKVLEDLAAIERDEAYATLKGHKPPAVRLTQSNLACEVVFPWSLVLRRLGQFRSLRSSTWFDIMWRPSRRGLRVIVTLPFPAHMCLRWLREEAAREAA